MMMCTKGGLESDVDQPRKDCTGCPSRQRGSNVSGIFWLSKGEERLEVSVKKSQRFAHPAWLNTRSHQESPPISLKSPKPFASRCRLLYCSRGSRVGSVSNIPEEIRQARFKLD
jgi:hypothetical protein